MFWKKSNDLDSLGVPLSDLQKMLAPTSIRVKRTGNVLLAQHEHYAIRIEVVPPEQRETENGPIRAVVRMITTLPARLLPLFQQDVASTVADFNSLAALGALYQDGGNVHIGSRLTIYDGDNAWGTLHLPLLGYTTICGSEAFLGGLRRTLSGEGHRGGTSKWNARDFEQVAGYLSRVSLCTHDSRGLTAEFALTDGAVSAAAGDRGTALFQINAVQPHPELGGGLFCLLQMPHQVPDKKLLARLCLRLNALEMAPRDLPPHFGAWCPGRMGTNPAYVCFLPNVLHSVPGIATNVAFWAMHRAQWAHAELAASRIRP